MGDDGAQAVLVVVAGRRGGKIGRAGEPGQRTVGAGQDVEGRRGAPGSAVLAVEGVAVVDVVGDGGVFGLLDAPAPGVVDIAGGGGAGGLAQPVEAVEGVLRDRVAGAVGGGAGDGAALALRDAVAGGVVDVGLQQGARRAAAAAFQQLVGGVVDVGGGGGDRIADLFLDAVAERIVGVVFPLAGGAVVDAGEAVEGRA